MVKCIISIEMEHSLRTIRIATELDSPSVAGPVLALLDDLSGDPPTGYSGESDRNSLLQFGVRMKCSLHWDTHEQSVSADVASSRSQTLMD